MQTNVSTFAQQKLVISNEALDKKIPPATSYVPTSFINDAAKDTMDISPLPQDDFSPGSRDINTTID
ncbi:hypothetical protein PanWU01x14_045940 [Parasponia andersonii]|uniref:Uncharacterized protein n=1 Tax=Parasponia andersonii TaxID=3476 RepID=A0A2P5DPL9_PARAD|nr:hypothetical protein PanWU01x14_045940 [Parasponia andersonii]